MDKYIELLADVPCGFLHLAKSFASDNGSPKIEPAHMLRALLHKNCGLADFIENTLDSDYYYLLDWADIRVSQAPKSPYPMKDAELSDAARSVVKEALSVSKSRGAESIDLTDILAAVVSPGVGFSAEQLKTMPLSAISVLEKTSAGSASSASGGTVTLQIPVNSGNNTFYTLPLDGNFEREIIGFDVYLRQLIEALSRRDRANVMIIGETGVGKSSLVYALMQQLKTGKLPKSLSALYPIELDLVALSQGVSYKGEVEDRLNKVLTEVSVHTRPLLIIENVHRIMDRQSVLNAVLPIIKKHLAENNVQMLFVTSSDSFTKDIEKDKELIPYFEIVSVDEPGEENAVKILESKIEAYGGYHGITIGDGVVEELVRLARRYMPEKHLPASSIDLMDRAMASLKIKWELSSEESAPILEKEYVRDVVASITGLPVGNIMAGERERLAGAEDILHRRVVGQNHAVKSILDAICESRSGLSKKGQPVGSFFFLGPTGTGKTELAKSLADFLFNDETSILRFDMSEYKEEHSVALLYGAPPGYVGYEEGGLLVNQIRRHPYSVVLFDEIEKAHRSVFDLFLQILDEGKLHDRLGRVGDFSNALIIFTSNIGSDYIFKSFETGHIPTHDEMLEVMQGQFRPEFLARLTEILPFSPITTEMISKIFDIHIRNLMKSLAEQDIRLEIDDTARTYITRTGFNTHYGARPVLGIIRKEIRRPLSKMIIAGDITAGDTVLMKYDDASKEMVWEID